MHSSILKNKIQSPLAGGVAVKARSGKYILGTHINNFSKNQLDVSAEIFSKNQLDVSASLALDTNEFNTEVENPETENKPVPENHPEVADSTVVKKGEYHPGYAQEILAYFDKPKTKRIYDTYTWKSGAVSEKERFVPNTPPHFSEFARSIGVTTKRLKLWADQYEEFGEAYQTCQEIYEEFLIENGLTGAYGAIMTKFVAVNKTPMKDKQTNENISINLNDVLDKIAEGKVRPGGLIDGE